MLTNVRYIFLTALRDWLFAALMIGVIVCALIAHMLGSTAIIETQEMTLSFSAAAARIVIMVGLIVFICFHVRNAFDTKEIDVFLSRPITRPSLVVSYWLGFAAVATLLVLPTAGLIAVQGLLDKPGFVFWTASLLVECWILMTVSLCAAFVLNSVVTSVMASMGFYVVARMMGFFVAMAQSVSAGGHSLSATTLKNISGWLPQLDYFARSEWLISGMSDTAQLKIIVAHGVLFMVVVIICTVIGFKRKQF
jgi:ABC-type transport system involved in multi-copper enzyme maturation permease subunit